MKYLLLSLLIGLFATPAQAQTAGCATANCPGVVCGSLGTTMMSDDRTSLIACLLDAGDTSASPSCQDGAGSPNGLCSWKNMVDGGSAGVLTVTGTNPTCPASHPNEIARNWTARTCGPAGNMHWPVCGNVSTSCTVRGWGNASSHCVYGRYDCTLPNCPSSYCKTADCLPTSWTAVLCGQ